MSKGQIFTWALVGMLLLILTATIVAIVYVKSQRNVVYIIDNSTPPAETPTEIPSTINITPNITILSPNDSIANATSNLSTIVNLSLSNLSTNTNLTPSVNITNITTLVMDLSIGTYNRTNCTWRLPYPDPECSPGKASNATKEMVCTSGYASSVRDVSQSTKDTVYRMYGVVDHTVGQWEIDHIISLELGGTNDIENLYPEPATPYPGYHQKDAVENYLHKLVCDGTMPLKLAQEEINHNWVAYISAATPTALAVNATKNTQYGDVII